MPEEETKGDSTLVSPPPVPKYGLGYTPDTHDKSQDPSVRGLLGAPYRVPNAFSLEQYVLSIYNQLQTSSCTGWAFAQALFLRCFLLGTKIDFPSPEAIYTFGRALARLAEGLKPDGNPLTDEGAQPSLIVKGMNKWGVPSNTVWPFNPDTINDEPNLEELEVASAFIISSCNRISSTGSGRLLDIRHAISQGYPVIIGTAVDQAFMNYAGGKQKNGLPNAVTAPDPKKILGGHMMHLVGYTAADLFRGVNQWGRAWGDNGLYWADENFITSDRMTDIYVLACNASGH